MLQGLRRARPYRRAGSPAATYHLLVTWLYWVTGFLPLTFLGTALLLAHDDQALPGPRWRARSAGSLRHLRLGQRHRDRWRDAGLVAPVRLLFIGLHAGSCSSGYPCGRCPPRLLTVCALAVVLRFAGSSGEQRLQLTWFAAAAGVLGVTLIPRILTNAAVSAIVVDLAVICLEATIAIAVLRYRLYDIDIVISRAVLYAILRRVFITAVYVVLVAGVGAWRPERGRAHAASRRRRGRGGRSPSSRCGLRAARLANLVVYGRRATPYQVLSDFAGRIGRAYSKREDVLPDMARVVAAGTGARPPRGLADGWRRAARRRLHRPVPAGDGAARAPRAGSPRPAPPGLPGRGGRRGGVTWLACQTRMSPCR